MKKYIVGPVFDWTFFLLPPVLCLVLGIALSGTWLTGEAYVINGQDDSIAGFALGTLVQAHLVAVVFRSHGNRKIRRLYPLRFFVVPVALWGAIVASPWIAVAATVVATFWDVWHSGAQTFGFARIYERNAGTPPELGRRFDFWLNQLCYAGPILAGATLMDHVSSFDEFSDVGDAVFSSVPARVEGISHWLTWIVLAVGAGFIVAYIGFQVMLARRGHRPSWQKVWLTASTALVSIYTWGFNSWGEAFLIMNLFHAVQYLALVWAKERPRLPLYLGGVLLYGFGVEILDPDRTWLWAITIVVSLMHFWYDAFVWSVRRAEV